jgi:hypothetical protein
VLGKIADVCAVDLCQQISWKSGLVHTYSMGVCSDFRVLGFRVYGLWFMVYGLGFMVYGLGFRVEG